MVTLCPEENQLVQHSVEMEEAVVWEVDTVHGSSVAVLRSKDHSGPS